MWYAIFAANALISGIMTYKLAQRKGYDGYFWTGFFLSFWGLIYVAGLPAAVSAAQSEMVLHQNRTCPSCGYIQLHDRATCWKCGASLSK